MSTYRITATGSAHPFTLPFGASFELMTLSAGTVSLEFENERGQVIERVVDATNYKARFPFGSIRGTISDNAAVLVVDVTRNGEAGANTFSGVVKQSVSPPVSLPYQLGAEQLAAASSTSAALVTVVTPAANVNGVVIKTMQHYGNTDTWALLAKESAPSTYDDAAAHCIFRHYSASGTKQNDFSPAHLQLPILIPAGFGIYHQKSGTAYAHSTIMTWDVL
jgi:hypothetical protein